MPVSSLTTMTTKSGPNTGPTAAGESLSIVSLHRRGGARPPGGRLCRERYCRSIDNLKGVTSDRNRSHSSTATVGRGLAPRRDAESRSPCTDENTQASMNRVVGASRRGASPRPTASNDVTKDEAAGTERRRSRREYRRRNGASAGGEMNLIISRELTPYRNGLSIVDGDEVDG